MKLGHTYRAKYDHLDAIKVNDANHAEVYMFLCEHAKTNDSIDHIDYQDSFVKLYLDIVLKDGNHRHVEVYNNTTVVAIPTTTEYPFFKMEYIQMTDFNRVFEITEEE